MTTIIVIDDDPVIASAVRAAQPTWTVLAATSATDGIDLVRQQHAAHEPLDLIVLDVHLPLMDGREICARVRQIAPDTPILPFTANDDPLLDAYLQEWGCASTLIKGVAPWVLAAAMQDALGASVTITLSDATRRYLQQRATDREHHLRATHPRFRAALYAPSFVVRLGIGQYLALAGISVMLMTGDVRELRRALPRIDALILPIESLAELADLCAQRPHLVLTARAAPAYPLVDAILRQQRPAPCALLLMESETCPLLPDAWAAVRAGRSFVDPSLTADAVTRDLPTLTAHLRRELGDPHYPERNALILALLAREYDYQRIAEHLDVPVTVLYRTLWRMRCRLHQPDQAALSRWARAWLGRALARTPPAAEH